MAAIRGRSRLTFIGVAVAAVTALVLAVALGAAKAPQPARAAQVPAAQADCPAQPDPTPLTRKTDAFARIDGIRGDATNARHAGEVALYGVRAGTFVGESALCAGTGKTRFDPIVVEKRIDSASVPLAGAAATGAHIKSVRIALSSGGDRPVDFMTYDLSDVRVLSIRQVMRGDTLTEEAVFDARRIAYAYRAVNPDGSAGAPIEFCYDVAANARC